MYPLEKKVKVFSYRTWVTLSVGINKRARFVADVTWVYTGQGVYAVTWLVDGLTGSFACSGVPVQKHVTMLVRQRANEKLAHEIAEWAKRYGESDDSGIGMHVIPDHQPVDNSVDNSEKDTL